jgi:AraC-like DNA-binding protein
LKEPVTESYPRVYLYRRIVQAKLFIDQHFREKINLDTIAGEAYFSQFHFIRLFKMAYQKTPHQYLIFVRIEHAKELLKNDHLSIAEICFAVGFESAGSFTLLFKRLTGLSPSQYRQQELERCRSSKHNL